MALAVFKLAALNLAADRWEEVWEQVVAASPMAWPLPAVASLVQLHKLKVVDLAVHNLGRRLRPVSVAEAQLVSLISEGLLNSEV